MNKLVLKTVHGSHLYGTNTPESDVDYKGVFVNTDFGDIILGRAAKHCSETTGNGRSKNTSSDIDIELFEIKRFIDEVCSGEMIALDMIHTPEDMIVEKGDYFYIWEFIQKNRQKLYSKNMRAYIGYARKQAAKYGLKGTRMAALEEVVKSLKPLSEIGLSSTKLHSVVNLLPTNEYCFITTGEIKGREDQVFYEVLGSKYQLTMPYIEFYKAIHDKWDSYGERARMAKENNGLDWKAISHALRACSQLEEIFTTGNLIYPLSTKDFLIDVKKGKLDWTTEVQPMLEKAIDDLEKSAKSSNLPEKVDKEWWYGKVVEWYKDILIYDEYF